MKTLALLRKAYLASLDAHVATIATDEAAHRVTEASYNLLEASFHDIAEQMQTVEENDTGVSVQEAYSALEEAIADVKESIKSEEDEWVKNVLIGVYEKLCIQCAKFKSLEAIQEVYEGLDKLEVQDIKSVEPAAAPKKILR